MQNRTLPRLLAAAGVAVVLVSSGPEAEAQMTSTPNCPGETATASVRVASLLSSRLMDARQRLGFAAADSAGMRLLVDESDGQTCRQIARVIQPKLRRPAMLTFYAAGPFFVVPASAPPLPRGQLRFGTSSLIYVLDADFNLVATVSG